MKSSSSLMGTDKPITRVTLHAKQRYCERRKLNLLKHVDAVRLHRGRKGDYEVLKRLDEEILGIVNHEAFCIRGLTKNNRNNALLLWDGLCFAVKYSKSKGTVITVFLESPNI